MWQLAAKIEKGSASSVPSRNLGVRVCRFTSADKLRIAQVGLQSCSFHQLRPYTRWVDVSKEALRLWAAYHGAMNPVEVTRLAVRNINQVLLPAGKSAGEYLCIVPTLPPGLEAAGIENSLLRYTVSRPYDGETLGANVILAFGQAPDGRRQVTLDVDDRESMAAPVDAGIRGRRGVPSQLHMQPGCEFLGKAQGEHPG